jgi:dTDP-4-amino-4,6-dideoxygalactose transaminase
MQELTVPFADLRAQHASLNGAVEAAIRTVLDDSAFIGEINNPHVLNFETTFAEYLGGGHRVPWHSYEQKLTLSVSVPV